MNEQEAYSTVIAQNEQEEDKRLIKILFRRYPLIKLGKLIDALNNASVNSREDRVSLDFLAETLQELLNLRVAKKGKKSG